MALNWGLLGAVAGCLLMGCTREVSEEPVHACSALPACDGDVVGTWQFDDMCPADRELRSDILPPECLPARV